MKQTGGTKTIIDKDLVKKVKDFVDSKVLKGSLKGSQRIWFYQNVAMAELRRAPPRDIGQLKTTVNAFAESLDYADVEKCVRHIRDRARACIPKTCVHFERGLNRLRVNWDGNK